MAPITRNAGMIASIFIQIAHQPPRKHYRQSATVIFGKGKRCCDKYTQKTMEDELGCLSSLLEDMWTSKSNGLVKMTILSTQATERYFVITSILSKEIVSLYCSKWHKDTPIPNLSVNQSVGYYTRQLWGTIVSSIIPVAYKTNTKWIASADERRECRRQATFSASKDIG